MCFHIKFLKIFQVYQLKSNKQPNKTQTTFKLFILDRTQLQEANQYVEGRKHYKVLFLENFFKQDKKIYILVQAFESLQFIVCFHLPSILLIIPIKQHLKLFINKQKTFILGKQWSYQHMQEKLPVGNGETIRRINWLNKP